MIKSFFICSLFFIYSQFSIGQEKFMTILDSLSVDQAESNVTISRSDTSYFGAMRNKQNFIFDENNAIYINSYEDFSIYLILSPNIFKKKKSNLVEETSSLTLLYDSNNDKCYLLKYDRNTSIYNNIDTVSLQISSNFGRPICSIVQLNNRLDIIDGFIFCSTNFLCDDERGRLISYSSFRYLGNSIFSKIVMMNQLSLNIDDMSYSDIKDLFSTNHFDVDKDYTEREIPTPGVFSTFPTWRYK